MVRALPDEIMARSSSPPPKKEADLDYRNHGRATPVNFTNDQYRNNLRYEFPKDVNKKKLVPDQTKEPVTAAISMRNLLIAMRGITFDQWLAEQMSDILNPTWNEEDLVEPIIK
jgi:hypothetical protein